MKLPRHYFENDFTEFEDYLIAKSQRLITYEPGDVLLSNIKNPELYVFYIIKGFSIVYSSIEDGNRKVMCFYAKGTILNMAIDDTQHSVFESEFVQAMTKIELLVIKKSDFIDMIKNNFKFNCAVFNFQNDLVTLLSYLSMALPYIVSETRLCDFLYMSWLYPPSAGKKNPEVLFISQDLISQYIGVTRTQVTRLLKGLRDEGIIETKRNSLIIKDLETLKSKCSTNLSFFK